MTEKIDPKLYHLSPRTVLLKKSPGKISIRINRKSRIIMKDAQSILVKANKIKEAVPDISVSLETTAPVCSKSIKFLKDNGVGVIVSTQGE